MKYHLDDIPAERRLETQRVFEYTREQVFQAFANPDLLVVWWGPLGFRNTFEAFEFRENGKWLFTMHGPDGADYYNESCFLRILEPEELVIDHQCAPYFQAHFRFQSVPEGCRVDWSMVFEDPQTCERVRKLAGAANQQNMDRLESALKSCYG